MKEKTLKELKEELISRERHVKNLLLEREETSKVLAVIVAAGLIDQDKINEARDIVRTLVKP